MIITKLTNQSHLKFQNYSKAIKAYLSNYFRIANGYCCKNYTNKLIVKKMYCISNNKRKIRKKLYSLYLYYADTANQDLCVLDITMKNQLNLTYEIAKS